MQSNFNPKHLKKAKETLSSHLSEVKVYVDLNETYKKEVFKRPSLWEKFQNMVGNS